MAHVLRPSVGKDTEVLISVRLIVACGDGRPGGSVHEVDASGLRSGSFVIGYPWSMSRGVHV